MFWKLTPREFGAMLEGHKRRELRDFSTAVAVAWHNAAFARAKKLPDLPRLLRVITGQAPARTPPQTPEQMLVIVRQWNQRFGGEDHTPQHLRKE